MDYVGAHAGLRGHADKERRKRSYKLRFSQAVATSSSSRRSSADFGRIASLPGIRILHRAKMSFEVKKKRSLKACVYFYIFANTPSTW